MAADVPPVPAQDASTWLKYMPLPIRWMVGAAMGAGLVAQFLPPSVMLMAAQFIATPAGLVTFGLICVASAVGLSLKSVDKRLAKAESEVRQCHADREDEREHYERRFNRMTGAILFFAKGESDKAIAEVTKLLGE